MICINSYPRSGNTYLHFSINRFIKKNELNNVELFPKYHDHSALLNNNINQVSILRNPLDSITSYALMMLWPSFKKIQEDEISAFIDDITKLYIDFMNNMQISKNLIVIFFEDLINKDINYFIIKILNSFNISIPIDLKSLSEDELFEMRQDMKNIIQNNIYSGHMPRPYSMMPERDGIKQRVLNGKYYAEALSLYNKNKDYFSTSKSLII